MVDEPLMWLSTPGDEKPADRVSWNDAVIDRTYYVTY
jgi:hypothetical protein